MAKRKILFVILEGPSDETVIGNLFDEIFDPDKVYVETMHCDILTDYLFNSKAGHVKRDINILKEIKNIVEAFINNNPGIRKTDIMQIIHICDTDGCFCSSSLVNENKSINGTMYYENGIETKNIEFLNRVRQLKCDNIKKLYQTSNIWVNIPYKLYYMSSSIDHVLYNKLNLTDEEKEKEAILFVKKYQNNWDDCVTYLSESYFSVNMDYIESWKFIMNDNSLKRYSNIQLCFPREKIK